MDTIGEGKWAVAYFELGVPWLAERGINRETRERALNLKAGWDLL